MVAKAKPFGFLFPLSSKMQPRLDVHNSRTFSFAFFSPVLNANGVPALFQRQLPRKEALDTPGHLSIFQFEGKGSVPQIWKMRTKMLKPLSAYMVLYMKGEN